MNFHVSILNGAFLAVTFCQFVIMCSKHLHVIWNSGQNDIEEYSNDTCRRDVYQDVWRSVIAKELSITCEKCPVVVGLMSPPTTSPTEIRKISWFIKNSRLWNSKVLLLTVYRGIPYQLSSCKPQSLAIYLLGKWF